MSLEPVGQLMAHARRNGYAVGYFESWDVASLEGVIDAAEQSRAPVVVGFNGEFLARAERQPAGPAGMVRRVRPGGGRVGAGALRSHVQRVLGRRGGRAGDAGRIQCGHAGRREGRLRRSGPPRG